MEQEQTFGSRALRYVFIKNIFGAILILTAFTFISFLKDYILSHLPLVQLGFSEEKIDQYFSLFWLILIFFIIIGLSFILLYDWLIHITTRFSLTDTGLKVRRGILSKHEISIPYRQIQNVNIEQSLLYRILSVANMIIMTAGHDEYDTQGEAEGKFYAIDSVLAYKLKEELLKRSSVIK